MLELVELTSQARKRPAQLSGGQQQRVALARALINSPRCCCSTSPSAPSTSSCAAPMQIEVKRIQVEVGLTFVHVTHDQEEAMTMADTVAVMNGGIIEQLGAPAELYENPRSTFVANFLGQSNLVEGDVRRRAADITTTSMQGLDVSVPTARVHTDSRPRLGRRPPREGTSSGSRGGARRAGSTPSPAAW